MNDDLILKMILDESGFTAGMNSAVKNLGSFEGNIEQTSKRSGSSLGSIWKVFVGSFLASGATKIVGFGFNLIRDSIGGAIDRVDTMNNAVRNFQNMGFEESEINKTIGEDGSLQRGIKGLPTTLNEAVGHVQLLASSTEDLGRSDQVFRALNDGILGFGGTTDQVNEAVIQLSQSFSNGKVDAQTWNSMINANLGPTLGAIAKKMGMTMGDLKTGLSEGTISVKEFQDQLIEMDTQGGGGLKSLNQIAQDSTKGIKTSIQNAKTAITSGVGDIIKALNQALIDSNLGGFKGIIDNFGNVMKSFLKVIAANIPVAVEFLGKFLKELQKFGSALKFILPFLVPAATAFGAFMFQLKGIPTIIKNFNNLKKAITGIGSSLKIMGAIAAANPFVLIVGAIVGAIAVFGYFMATNEEFRNKVIAIWNDVKTIVIDTLKGIKGWGIKAWDSIKETASNAVQGVKDAWSGTKQWFSDTWSDIKEGAKGLFDNAVDSAKSGASKAKDSWGDAKQWFSSTWDSIKDSASKTWSTIQDAIMPYVGPLVNGIRNSFIHVFFFLEDLWTNLIEIGRNTFELLKNVILAPILFITSMITGGWEETKHNMLAVWENIKEAAGNIWTSIQNIFSSYITNIYMAALNVWTGFKNTILNIWNEVVFQGKMIWIGIQSFFANLWIDMKYKAIQMWIDLKFAVIKTWFDLKYGAIETWNSIKQFFSDTWQSIKTGAADTWNAIKDTTVNVWNAIKQFFWDTVNNIVRTAQNAWNDLKQGVSDAIDRVKNIFESLRDINLLEIGKNIIQGLIDGIAEKFNSLKKKVKDVASLIKNGITGALDINSPSRWMRDMVGKNIVQGIIVGLDQEKPKLDASMGGLVDTPVVNPSSNSLGASPSTVNARQTGTTNQQTEIHLHLNVYGDLPDSMVKALSKKLTTEITRQMKRDATAIGGALYAN